MNDHIDSKEVWNESLADSLAGKVLLVGITYIAEDDSLSEQQQFFGTVQSTHPRNGILLALGGQRSSEQYNLPPDTRSILIASPGEYRLRTTGEVVANPDYTVAFAIHKAGKNHGA